MNYSDTLKPTILAIFGGAGDLTWRKLVPALYDLTKDREVPPLLSIIVLDRVDMKDEELRDKFHEGVKKFSRNGKTTDKNWDSFARHIYYQKGDFKNPDTYKELKKRCADIGKEWNAEIQCIYYMATPPMMFGVIPKYLAEAGMMKDLDKSRIVVEKPIGYDLSSARELNEVFTRNFDESQIFRIDHYLGKETVQNILAFRFANPLFEPLWNRRYVDHISITVAEALGIGNRGGYYDKAGELRDMVQNHLMQLLCIVAMEPMVSFDANEVRNKKVDVLHAVRTISHDDVHKYFVRGQYGKGQIGKEKVNGYREENGVDENSMTETFVAMNLFVDNWRWQDVPFYLRTGKRLARRASEIVVQFREVPHRSFPEEGRRDWPSSRLIILIQPDEGIILRFQAKEPGPEITLKPVDMRFDYRDYFSGPFPDAYETLFNDLIQNDATPFMRADQVEAAWKILMPVLEVWADKKPSTFPNYSAGSWGPEAADNLLTQHGHFWTEPEQLEKLK